MIDWDAIVGAPCMKVFGETLKLSYTPPGGGVPTTVDGIFDDAYMALLLGDEGAAVGTLEPIVGVRAAQFPAGHPLKGGQLVVPRVSKTFIVESVEPDGKGAINLRLGRSLP